MDFSGSRPPSLKERRIRPAPSERGQLRSGLLLGFRLGLLALMRLTNKALPLGAVLRTLVQGNKVPATVEPRLSLWCCHTKNPPIQKKCGGSSFRHPPFGVGVTFALLKAIQIAPNRDNSPLREREGC